MSLLHQFFNFLLPPRCVLCSTLTHNDINICAACEQDLPILSHSCVKCAQELSDSQLTCGTCLVSTPPFDHTIALYRYEEPVTRLITGLKFTHKLTYAQALGELMAKSLPLHYQHSPLPDLLIPIPLHARRLRERGFNQAIEIARPVIKALNIPIDYKSTFRTRHTSRQSDLPAKSRRQNILHAFTCERDFANAHVAVIDDVVTTGHTMREFCTELRRCGASRIDVWCVARA